MYKLGVKRALAVYLERSRPFFTVDSLFVTFGLAGQGLKPSVATLSRWLKWAILAAYESVGESVPGSVQGRSTRGMAFHGRV